MDHRLFVYGTLQRGYGNNRLLTRSEYLGPAKTAPLFRLLAHGPRSFPLMVPAEPGAGVEVVGELFSVPASELGRIDQLEGHPTFYERQEIRLANGERAEAYVYQRARGDRRFVELPNGDWKAWFGAPIRDDDEGDYYDEDE